MAGSLLQIAAMTAGLAAVFGGTGPLLRWIGRCIDRRREARQPRTNRRPIQVVAADIRRLARQLSLVPAGAPSSVTASLRSSGVRSAR